MIEQDSNPNADLKPRGFSLVEVVIALGVTSVVVIGVLALLPSLIGRSSAASDAERALGMADAITSEIQRIGQQRGYGSLGSLPPPNENRDVGLLLVAARDSAGVRELGSSNPDGGDEYFLIEIRAHSTAPFVYNPSAAYLVLSARVSWPYRSSTDGTPTDPRDRHSVMFNVSVNR